MRKSGAEWQLKTAPGNTSQLEAAPAETLRVTVANAAPGAAFDIQLNGTSYALTSGAQYVLKGLARSDRPCTIWAACSQNHDLYENLGLYSALQLTTDWRFFEKPFQATQTDANARVHFDLGGALGVVEVSSVRLYCLAGDSEEAVLVNPAAAPRAISDTVESAKKPVVPG